MKKRRAFYNLIVGMGSKLILAVLSFAIPKLFIENYGSDVNGLLTSIAQVFSYLALAEAGIGVATTQALYKPVAENDWNEINAIMNAASRFYKRTGTIYFFGVIATAVLYPLLVFCGLDFKAVFLIVIFSGMRGVLSYFFQSKYFALLNTEGKSYVHVAIGTIIAILTQILKLIMICLSANIVFIYFVYFLVDILQIAAINIYMRKNYKNKFNSKIKPNTSALSQHNSVLVHQVSSLIFSNTDVLILTAFESLKKVSIYNVYNLVVTSISSLVNTALDSFTSALGLIYNEDKKRFLAYYDVYELLNWIIYFIIMTVTLILYEPFISLYTAKADIAYTDKWLPILFTSNQLLSLIRMPGLRVINIEGCFKDTRSRTIIESVINLSVSLITVQFMGIYGVLLGTTAALLYRTVDIIAFSNNRILHRNKAVVIRRLTLNTVIMVAVKIVINAIGLNINNVFQFIYNGAIYTVITAALFVGINYLFEKKNKNLKLLSQLIRRR